jgi:hypothetical protein
VPGLIVPFKRAVYEQVVEAFAPFALAATDERAGGPWSRLG